MALQSQLFNHHMATHASAHMCVLISSVIIFAACSGKEPRSIPHAAIIKRMGYDIATLKTSDTISDGVPKRTYFGYDKGRSNLFITAHGDTGAPYMISSIAILGDSRERNAEEYQELTDFAAACDTAAKTWLAGFGDRHHDDRATSINDTTFIGGYRYTLYAQSIPGGTSIIVLRMDTTSSKD